VPGRCLSFPHRFGARVEHESRLRLALEQRPQLAQHLRPDALRAPPQQVRAVRLRGELVPLHRGVPLAQRCAELARRGAHRSETLFEPRHVLGIVEHLFLGKAREEVDELRLL